MSRLISWGFCTTIIAVFIVGLGCGGGAKSTPQTPQTGFVNAALSDPATCSAPAGPYSHVFVTVTDVKIHTNTSAEGNEGGWIDLTPDLKNSPKQVDLLSQPDTRCFLAMLGSKTEVQAGSYQQIRIYLADDNTSISGNQCAAAPGHPANCVILAADSSVHALKLTSEAKTGLKIPSGQIAGGKFTIGAGETKDLDIDFNACASIVATGGGQFILKPVLHAGEVALSSSINGTIVDSVTGQAIVGGAAIVALEQKDSTSVDRVLMSTTADGNGGFALCPVPTGSYDLVVAAVNGAGVFYAGTVTTGVQNGTSVGKIPLTPEPGPNTGPASLTGAVETSSTSGAISEIVMLSALQTISIGGSNVLVTIPLVQQSLATANVTTEGAASCESGFDCVDFTLALPGVNAFVGSFGVGGTVYSQGAGPAIYTVDAQPISHQDDTQACGQADAQSSAIAVTPGNSFSAGTLTFTGCT
jgi:hypothetical protein